MSRSPLLVLACVALGFSMPSHASQPISYTIRVYASGGATPLKSTTVAASALTCGQTPVSGMPLPILGAPPITLRITDPLDETKDCLLVDNGSGPILPLQTGTGSYAVTLSAIWDTGESAPAAFVYNAPTQPGTWEPVVTLTGSQPLRAALDAFGTTVVANTADLRLYVNRSLTQGPLTTAGWIGPLSSTTTDVGYLEHPIAISATQILHATVEATQSITDFCCSRQVGDVFVWRSTDNGATYPQRIRVTTGRKVIRLALRTDGPKAYLTYTTWVGPTSPGTWHIEFTRSIDGGQTWAAPQTIATGINAVGAERSSMAVSNGKILLAWMDAQNATGPCTVEGGAQLPQCTQVFTARSVDDGLTFTPGQPQTPLGIYSGRPDVTRDGDQIVIHFDRHSQQPGATNDIAQLLSTDDGVSWAESIVVGASGDQTHSTPAWHPTRGLGTCWMDRRVLPTELRCAFSTDGGATWVDEQVVSAGGETAAPNTGWTSDAFHVIWPRVKGTIQYRRKVWTP